MGNCRVQAGPGWVVGCRGAKGAVFCIRVQQGRKTRQQSRRRMRREQGEEEGLQGKREVCSNVRDWYGALAGTGPALAAGGSVPLDVALPCP